MNEKGNTTLLSLLFLMIITFFALLTLSFHMKKVSALKKKQDLLLCAKYVDGESKQHISRMQIMNNAIRLLDKAEYTKYLSVVIPILGPVSAAANVIKKLVQGAQETDSGIHITKMVNQIHSRNCFIDPYTILGPYKRKLKLTRNFEGIAIMRKQRWKSYLINKKYLIQLDHNQVTNKTKSMLLSSNIKDYPQLISSFMDSLSRLLW